MLSCRDVADDASDYVDGDLALWRQLEIRIHIFLCRDCARYLHQLKLSLNGLRALGNENLFSGEQRTAVTRPNGGSSISEEQMVERLQSSLQAGSDASSGQSGAPRHVILYTAPGFPSCRQAKAFLRRKGFAYQEIDVDRNPDRREEMVALSGGGTTVPQIFVRSRHIGGCDELYRLDATGKLAALLGR